MMRPTQGGIRNDSGGAGYYGAPRKKGVTGMKYRHQGTDYACEPGEPVRSPCTGRIIRRANPYVDGPLKGVLIESKRAAMKLFYVDPKPELIGEVIQQGQIIGTAQDVSLRYPASGVTPHVHLQITSLDPEVLMDD